MAGKPWRRQGMSEAAYAERSGLTRAGVNRARISGRLVLFEDGSIDAAASDLRRAQATDPARVRGGVRPVPTAAVEEAQAALREQQLPAPEAGGMTYLHARTVHEVLKVQDRRIELRRKNGELIDRAKAIATVFQLARQERDAWAGWPARVAAVIAAELGVDAHAVQTVLERYVRDHLAELADLRPSFH